MKLLNISKYSPGFWITVSVVVIMIFVVSRHHRDNVLAWRTGVTYLGNQGIRFQTGINDCGPASLQMIFDYYGVQCSIKEIEHTIQLNQKGSTMLALKEMSELKGLHAEGWRLNFVGFSNILFPALLFIHDDHFVVADSFRNGNVFVRDPAIGRLKIPQEKLIQIWKGEILLFRRK